MTDLGIGHGEPVPLRDWLVYYDPQRDSVWAEVVAEFDTTAAADPDIADYFIDPDLARTAEALSGRVDDADRAGADRGSGPPDAGPARRGA